MMKQYKFLFNYRCYLKSFFPVIYEASIWKLSIRPLFKCTCRLIDDKVTAVPCGVIDKLYSCCTWLDNSKPETAFLHVTLSVLHTAYTNFQQFIVRSAELVLETIKHFYFQTPVGLKHFGWILDNAVLCLRCSADCQFEMI